MSEQKATPDNLERGRKNLDLAHELARAGADDRDGLEWIVTHLSHIDPMVRERALGAAVRCGVLSDEQLCTALSDPAQRVRLRALRLVATLTPEGADEQRRARFSTSVAPLIDDQDELIGEAAAFALGELVTSDPTHLDALERAAASAKPPLVREASVAALGAIGLPRSLPAVLAACGDKATVRRRATIALAAFEGPEVERALAAAARDRDWQVRDIARSLHDIDEPGGA